MLGDQSHKEPGTARPHEYQTASGYEPGLCTAGDTSTGVKTQGPYWKRETHGKYFQAHHIHIYIYIYIYTNIYIYITESSSPLGYSSPQELEGEGGRGRGIDQPVKHSPRDDFLLRFEIIVVSFGTPWSPRVKFFWHVFVLCVFEASFVECFLDSSLYFRRLLVTFRMLFGYGLN